MTDIRVLVTGDREWTASNVVDSVLEGHLKELSAGSKLFVIEGEARGADTAAKQWTTIAKRLGLPVELLSFPAEWRKFGKGAGPIRNGQMLREGAPTCCNAFHDDLEHSKGTMNMCAQTFASGILPRLWRSDGSQVPPNEVTSCIERYIERHPHRIT